MRNSLDVFLIIWSTKPPMAANGTRNAPQQKQLLTLDDSLGAVKGSCVGCAGSTVFVVLDIWQVEKVKRRRRPTELQNQSFFKCFYCLFRVD